MHANVCKLLSRTQLAASDKKAELLFDQLVPEFARIRRASRVRKRRRFRRHRRQRPKRTQSQGRVEGAQEDGAEERDANLKGTMFSLSKHPSSNR